MKSQKNILAVGLMAIAGGLLYWLMKRGATPANAANGSVAPTASIPASGSNGSSPDDDSDDNETASSTPGNPNANVPVAPASTVNGIPVDRLNADSAAAWNERLLDLAEKGKQLIEGSPAYKRQAKRFTTRWLKEHADEYRAPSA